MIKYKDYSEEIEQLMGKYPDDCGDPFEELKKDTGWDILSDIESSSLELLKDFITYAESDNLYIMSEYDMYLMIKEYNE